MMNRVLLLMLAAAAALSCTAKTEIIPAFQPGNAVAVCHVGSSGGEVSVLVETQGQWRLRTEDAWISTDVQGGSGRGAFTFRCSSNQPGILDLKPHRIGRIAICLEECAKADTLVVVQKGFLSPQISIPTTEDPALKLEFDTPAELEVKLLIASSEGASATAVAEWARTFDSDLCVLDGVVSGGIDGLNILGCNFAGQTPDQRFDSFREALQTCIGRALVLGNDWIVCGQMYHYSAMQVGYPETPSWYPDDASGSEFRGDRYAWQNNFYDLLWMKDQGWVETYTDSDGHSWQADYVYVSSTMLDKVSSVEILPAPVSGMLHKPVAVVLKY